MSKVTEDLSPLEWRIVFALRKRPAGSSREDVLSLVPGINPTRLGDHLLRILDKGYATSERQLGRGRGRPRFLYRPAGCIRSELRARIEEYLRSEIRSPEALHLLQEALEEHRRSTCSLQD